jgi:chromosomal replication initiator protein
VTTADLDAVAALGRAISQRIGEPRYNLWFDHNTKFSWDDAELTVGVPNHFFQEWLQNTFTEPVRAAASDVLGRPIRVRFAIDAELFQAARRAQERSRPKPLEKPLPGSGPVVAARVERQPERPAAKRVRHWRRLCDFVVGPCNRLAHACAVSLVEAPEQAANPLVLHGPVGTGKTHLLEGIYSGLRKERPDWRISIVTSEEFTNRFVQAMRAGKLGAFRRHFRECDVLLIDDLQFLASKRATQEEFLHTFEALYSAGCQLVITSDCHPKLADDFAPELADRLLGGAVWSLTPPAEDTRLDVLRAKAGRREPLVPDEVLRFLAQQLRGNVRELEGALHTVRHHGRVAGKSIDLALARDAVGELLRHSVRSFQLADVEQAVCRALRLDPRALQSKQRAWSVSHPRMLAMYLSRRHTGASYSEIGLHFGGRNHSTAVAAEKKVRCWLQEQGEIVAGSRLWRVSEAVEIVERELTR